MFSQVFFRVAVPIVAATVLAAGCVVSAEDPEPRTRGPARSSTSASTTPEPSPTPRDRHLRWSVELGSDAGTAPHQWVVDGVPGTRVDLLAMTGMTLRAFDRRGAGLWKRAFPKAPDTSDGSVSRDVMAARGAAIVTYDDLEEHRTKDWNIVEALDPASGKPLWKATVFGDPTVTGRTVFTATCRERAPGRPDDCRLSARDPRTGRARWTVPTEYAPRVLSVSDRFVVLATIPEGGYRPKDRRWARTLDPATGRQLSPRFPVARFTDVPSNPYLVGDVVVSVWPDGKNQECRRMVYGVDARTGAERWRRIVRTAPPDKSQVCRGGRLPSAGASVYFGVEGDRPSVVDLRTGRVRWTAKRPGQILDAQGSSVLALDEKKWQLSLYDSSTGRLRWTVPSPGRRGEYGPDLKVGFLDGRVAVHNQAWSCPENRPSGCTYVYDLATGRRALTLPVEPVEPDAFGQARIVGEVTGGTIYRVYATR